MEWYCGCLSLSFCGTVATAEVAGLRLQCYCTWLHPTNTACNSNAIATEPMPCHNFIHFLTCISKLSALTYCLGRNERHLLSATANYGLSADWYRSDYRVSQFPRFLHHEKHDIVISRWWWRKRRTSSKWVMHMFLCFETDIFILVTIIILSFIYNL